MEVREKQGATPWTHLDERIIEMESRDLVEYELIQLLSLKQQREWLLKSPEVWCKEKTSCPLGCFIF
mgnify:CR=1 FL=1